MEKKRGQELVEDVKNELEQLKQERQKREADWQEVQNLIAPSVERFYSGSKIPERPTRYSNTAAKYLRYLRSGVSASTANPNDPWQRLTLKDEKMLEWYGVKDWLEATATYAEYRRSNLYE